MSVSAPTGQHKLAQRNALGTSVIRPKAPTGRNGQATTNFAPLGLAPNLARYPARCTGLFYRAPLELNGWLLIALNQIPQIPVQILEHGHCAVTFLFWFADEFNPQRNHFPVIAPEIIGLQK